MPVATATLTPQNHDRPITVRERSTPGLSPKASVTTSTVTFCSGKERPINRRLPSGLLLRSRRRQPLGSHLLVTGVAAILIALAPVAGTATLSERCARVSASNA